MTGAAGWTPRSGCSWLGDCPRHKAFVSFQQLHLTLASLTTRCRAEGFPYTTRFACVSLACQARATHVHTHTHTHTHACTHIPMHEHTETHDSSHSVRSSALCQLQPLLHVISSICRTSSLSSTSTSPLQAVCSPGPSPVGCHLHCSALDTPLHVTPLALVASPLPGTQWRFMAKVSLCCPRCPTHVCPFFPPQLSPTAPAPLALPTLL